MILAILRYKLRAYPIDGVAISSKNSVYQSLLAWGLSCILIVLIWYCVVPANASLDMNEERMGYTIIDSAIFLCTVVPVIICFVVKMRNHNGSISRMSSTIHSINKMALAICIAQSLTALYRVVLTVSIFLDLYEIEWLRSRILYFRIGDHYLNLLDDAMKPIFFFHFAFCRRVLHRNRSHGDLEIRDVDTPV